MNTTLARMIRARLEELEATPYRVSVDSGHRAGWLAEALRRLEGRRPSRQSGKVTLDFLVGVMKATGLPLDELIRAAVSGPGITGVKTSGDGPFCVVCGKRTLDEECSVCRAPMCPACFNRLNAVCTRDHEGMDGVEVLCELVPR